MGFFCVLEGVLPEAGAESTNLPLEGVLGAMTAFKRGRTP